jgi:hypothetical protein
MTQYQASTPSTLASGNGSAARSRLASKLVSGSTTAQAAATVSYAALVWCRNPSLTTSRVAARYLEGSLRGTRGTSRWQFLSGAPAARLMVMNFSLERVDRGNSTHNSRGE